MATREVKCPFCNGEVLPKKNARPFSKISGFVQRTFNIKIPTGLMGWLQQNNSVSKDSIWKNSGECTCKGKKSFKDPSDDSAKWEAVKGNAQAAAKEIEQAEADIGAVGGNFYSLVQGHALLEFGLGMNDAPSYRVDKEKSIRNKGLLDPSKTNTKQGGPIPEGAPANHVQGINSLASPGGHLQIKCANKMTLQTGAQGLDFNTGGPLTISGGITRITGPEISIGTQTGRLALEGETLNLNGKSIEAAPSDGHFFVKGTISNTGNLMVGGHAHLESASVVKMETTGRNEVTSPAANTDTYQGPAFWSYYEGLPAAMKDLLGYVTANLTNPVHAQQIVTPRFVQGITDKMQNLAYHMRFTESLPTGVIYPGFCLVIGTGNLGYPVVSVNPSFVPIWNFPHCHAAPDNNHTHEVRVPDIDYSADSEEELRGKQSGVSASAPLHKTQTQNNGFLELLWSVIGLVFVPPAKELYENTYNK